jgi:lipopolysaccharide transport system permease protein
MLPTTTSAPGLNGTASAAPPPALRPRVGADEIVEVVVGPKRGFGLPDLGELWRHRELLYFLTWRDVKVRYKQTVLGVAWAVIQPLFTVVVFTVLFSIVAGMPSGDLPYPVLCFSALLPWTYFANVLGTASNSLVNNAHLVNKVYFPRLLIPVSAVLTGLVDFAIAIATLLVLMLCYRLLPPLSALVTVPLLTLVTSVFGLGVSLWLSALNVRYRDVRHVVPFLLQLWMYATPIVYTLSLVQERVPWLRWAVILNPMTGVIEGFRSALLGQPWNLDALAVSGAGAAVMLALGIWYFRRIEDEFADVI